MNNPETPLALTLLLGILIALSALGTDMYVPALPAVGEAFAAPVGAAQLTLTTYFIGLAAGQLIWGPLSDRYGRKPVLFAALAIAMAVTAAAPLLPSIGALAAARLAQGFAMAGGVVVARSIVRDLHAHEQAARLLARMMIVFSVVPIAAPIAGAALTAHAGWRAVFFAFAVIAALLLVAVAAGLRETAPAVRQAASPADIARRLRSILTDRRFFAPLLVYLSCQMGILAWVSASSFTLVRGAAAAHRHFDRSRRRNHRQRARLERRASLARAGGAVLPAAFRRRARRAYRDGPRHLAVPAGGGLGLVADRRHRLHLRGHREHPPRRPVRRHRQADGERRRHRRGGGGRIRKDAGAWKGLTRSSSAPASSASPSRASSRSPGARS